MSTLNAKETETKTESSEGTISPLPESQAPPTIFDTDSQTPFSDTFGRMSLENAETSYVGSVHWMAILDGVGTFLTSSFIVFKRFLNVPEHMYFLFS